MPTIIPAAEAPGIVKMFGGSTAPAGYLMCDGSAVSRTTYAALYAAIGTTWGPGDGSTTFNLPNSAGRHPIGVGTDPQGSARTLGLLGGRSDHTHGHASNSDYAMLRVNTSDTQMNVLDQATPSWTSNKTSQFAAAATVSSTARTLGISLGGNTDTPSSGNPPYFCLNFIIKT